MRWDRNQGGCIPSVITGTDSAEYDGNTNCAVDPDSEDGDCIYDEAELDAYQTDSVACWNELGFGSFTVDYFMTHFCMPDVTARTLDPADVPDRSTNCND